MYQSIRYYRQLESTSIVPVPNLDPATLAWIAAVVANGGTVSTARRLLVNNLIAGLKADGIWTKLDRLWLFAAENAASALTDVVGGNLASVTTFASGTPSFTVDRGYQDTGNPGDGGLIDSGVVENAATNFVQNSASLLTWCNTTGVETGNGPFAGENSGAGYVQLFPSASDGNTYWTMLHASGPILVTATPDPRGLWVMNRSGATAGTLDFNGTQIDSTTLASTIGPGTLGALVGAQAPYCSAKQVSCFGFGGSLSGADRSNIYSRLRTYMTAVGVP